MLPALLELRRYRLHPGTRDTLTRVFVLELVHTQEAVGLQVIGPYADEDEPDHLVWLRGFASEDPDARGAALAAFYGGPAWAAHKDVANATMVAFDDVHLLRPVAGDAVPDRFPALPVREDRVVVALLPAGAPAPVAAPHAATLRPLG